MMEGVRVFKVSEEYYAARDEASALEGHYARTGDTHFEERDVEEETDLDARQEMAGRGLHLARGRARGAGTG